MDFQNSRTSFYPYSPVKLNFDLEQTAKEFILMAYDSTWLSTQHLKSLQKYNRGNIFLKAKKLFFYLKTNILIWFFFIKIHWMTKKILKTYN